ncbi:serine/threonine-protein kinase [Natranaerovirga hydrolytica]|uniref:non-specific serine/threonine protein kinase n=1 Tax=Natranaerovirga hydrolytica TaxID=680378 RepID=A0A4R1N0E9_9FIRM|nr:Stk1 family PASTA domain-containing Ser/Thr kinase [Natranaerovirga hydrolytica]TCK98332.1 serine/threonine-protein kinase [Natranaerovirga hydrolytica]
MLQKGFLLNNRYEIIEKIGSGGMSDVYKAKCKMLNRFVAIKVLKDEFRQDDNFVTKFRVEAQSAASLSHQNIVNIYDVGQDQNVYYIVMELVEGITLKEYIKEKGILSSKETIALSMQIASGMEHAHNNHIIHRDIKPQNIIISDGKIAKVTDFGIARAASSATISAANVAGSVHYISPEQARGGYTDEKSDLYSLGITMYEMATGKVPFEGDNNVSVALSHLQDDIKKPSEVNPEIASSLEDVIIKLTQKKTDLRYDSTSDLIEDLRKALNAPEGDFVKIDSVPDKDTIFMSEEEVKQLRNVSLKDMDDFFEDEVEEKKETSQSDKLIERLIVGSGIILALLLVSVITFFAVNRLQERFIPEEIVVPSVEGYSEEEASRRLANLNLILNVDSYQYSEEVEEGLIIVQSPEEGTIVNEEAIVNVIVSQGIQRFRVPSVTDLRFNDAERLVIEQNLKPERELQYSDTVPMGVVMEQYPQAGEWLRKDETVVIVVSNGREPIYTTVPDVRGETEATARNMLESNNLEVGNVSQVESQTYPEGTVVSQTVSGGEEVEEGYVIDIVVSLGYTQYYEERILIQNVLEDDLDYALIKIELHQDGEVTTIFEEQNVFESDFPLTITVEGKEGGGTIYLYRDGEHYESWPIYFSPQGSDSDSDYLEVIDEG